MLAKSRSRIALYVENAARRLDKLMSGWYNEINTNKLELGCLDNCICGQLYGYWGNAPSSIKNMPACDPVKMREELDDWTNTDNGYNEMESALNKYWTMAILRRKHRG